MPTFLHTIPPVFDENSRILILGSFPSAASREAAFFYGHPRNRFWKVLAAVYDRPVPETVEEKRRLLLQNGIALWDVIACCSIEGSADSSITGVVPNDLSRILESAPVKRICVNGKTAEKYYDRFLLPRTGIRAVCLPSTSPANAAKSLRQLIEEWSVLRTDQGG